MSSVTLALFDHSWRNPANVCWGIDLERRLIRAVGRTGMYATLLCTLGGYSENAVARILRVPRYRIRSWKESVGFMLIMREPHTTEGSN